MIVFYFFAEYLKSYNEEFPGEVSAIHNYLIIKNKSMKFLLKALQVYDINDFCQRLIWPVSNNFAIFFSNKM